MKSILCLNNRNFNKVIIDSSALLQQELFLKLMNEVLIPAFRECGMKLTVPESVKRELNKLVSEGIEKADIAKKTLDMIEILEMNSFIKYEGNREERTDAFIMCETIKARMNKEKVLVITQVYQFAADLMLFNRIRSMWGPACKVQRINKEAQLENFKFSSDMNDEKKEYSGIQNALKRFGI